MAGLGSIGSALRRFRGAETGAVAITLGIAAIPLLLAAGVALDFVHASTLKSKLQSALDAAALAAATSQNLSTKERIAMAEAVFDTNWQGFGTKDVVARPNFAIEGNGVLASADVQVPTALMRIVGIKSMPIGSDVTISIPEDKKAEVVLSLDYSGSMRDVSGGKVKYVAMKDAATKLINDLGKAAKDRFKIGLVPFSNHVYLTMPKQYVLGQTGSGDWTGCTVDRQFPYNTTDNTPITDLGSKWGQPQDPIHITYGCSGYAPRNLKVLPLTSDFAAATGQLSIMTPYEWTHIAVGAEFGWHLLSPNAPFTDAAAYSDEETKKFMVLLTDGRQTEPAYGPGGKRSTYQGEKNLEKICEGMKAKGITIVTVAFDLQDDSTRDRLRNCATDPDKNFFIAESGEEVAQAFEEIKAQIAAKIYISK